MPRIYPDMSETSSCSLRKTDKNSHNCDNLPNTRLWGLRRRMTVTWGLVNIRVRPWKMPKMVPNKSGWGQKRWVEKGLWDDGTRPKVGMSVNVGKCLPGNCRTVQEGARMCLEGWLGLLYAMHSPAFPSSSSHVCSLLTSFPSSPFLLSANSQVTSLWTFHCRPLLF